MESLLESIIKKRNIQSVFLVFNLFLYLDALFYPQFLSYRFSHTRIELSVCLHLPPSSYPPLAHPRFSLTFELSTHTNFYHFLIFLFRLMILTPSAIDLIWNGSKKSHLFVSAHACLSFHSICDFLFAYIC